MEPGWLASRVATLAEAFHWDEEFILYRLPVSRGEQYYHVLLRKARWRTYEPATSAVEQLAQIDTASAPWTSPHPEIEEAWQRFNELQS